MNLPRLSRGLLSPTLHRVAIENVDPEIEGGRFPIKRIVGDQVIVKADIHADGHEILSAALLYRPMSQRAWDYAVMQPVGNDRWEGRFTASKLEDFLYTIQGWLDAFRSWNRDLLKKYSAGQEIAVDFLVGAELANAAAHRANGEDSRRLTEFAEKLTVLSRQNRDAAMETARDLELAALAARYPDRSAATTYERELRVNVDRERAGFSAWYEMFPRSCTKDARHHGTFRDCSERLPYISEMGFDVLYFPPIHPIGRIERKGKNNTPNPSADDPGSPWAIGSAEGGHKAIHPRLGTLEDLKELQAKARELNVEIALDLAFQAAPDHPYVKAHKEWFRERPDGSVQYAENPPKKYQDIYPFDFESEYAIELCEELKSVAFYWAEQGIRIFRVDNPHTKPFAFWEWLIAEVRERYPDAIFLAEAFTRPKVMYRLAKIGFTQSYTYFAWKNTKRELEEYFTELTQTEVRDFFRPNLWPNTPDILNEYLQFGGRPAFMTRFILAATLGANYGILGPAFELCESRPVRPGSEEYMDSEKYQIRVWDLDRPESLKPLITRVNAIRREHHALQRDRNLVFHRVDNEQLIAYSKATDDWSDIILVVVNLDPHYTQSGWIDVSLDRLGMDPRQSYQVEDLLTGELYLWHGAHNYVELNPSKIPAHIFRIRRQVRTERDFEYFF